MALLQTILIGGPIWSLSKENLALGTSAIVTCEMVSGKSIYIIDVATGNNGFDLLIFV